MTASTTARPGDLWVANTGNSLIAKAIRFFTKSSVNHAGIYLDGGLIGEAKPHGYRVGRNNYPASMLITVPVELTDLQRLQVTPVARSMVGIPYSFVDILVLAIALATHLPTPGWVKRRMANPRHEICSQADSWIMDAIGMHMFNDGRLPGEVTPEDIRSWVPKMGRNTMV